MKKIKWLEPLFNNAAGHKIILGIKNNQWYIQDKQPILVENDKVIHLLLPMMEKERIGSPSALEAKLKLLLEKISVDEAAIKNFPFWCPVNTAFHLKMNYWIHLSTLWIENLEINLKQAELILSLSNEKWIEQGNRHRLMKVLKRWEKKNKFCLIKNNNF
ncbi:MAG: hypothetical protein AAGB12_15745 [Pseudomonadota bacterium]